MSKRPFEDSEDVGRLCALVGRALGTLWRSLLEAVLELPRDELEGPHAASSGGLSSLGLLTPVVCECTISQMFQVEVNRSTSCRMALLAVAA